MKTENILGVNVNPLDYQYVVKIINTWIQQGQTRFISIAAVNNIVCALKDERFKKIENSADMVTTDGMPLVWVLKHRGNTCSRVYGPTLMLHVLKLAQEKGYSVYFYGCTEEIINELIEKLKEQFYELKIAGYYAPPFRALTEEENLDVVNKINAKNPQLIFVGLSTPKQEYWMHKNRPYLKNCVMLGVGAAFLFHAGRVKQAPLLIQNLGLEWLFRLAMEPKRLWKRYVLGNSYFIWHLFKARFFKSISK